MKKGVSIKKIAQELNLSQGTVSLVLNDRGTEMRISEDTQKRVYDKAKALGYFKSHNSSKKLKPVLNNAPVITFFCPYVPEGGPLGRVMLGVQNMIRTAGFPLQIIFQPFELDNLEAYASRLSSKYCNGAIILNISENDFSFLSSHKINIPVVLFNYLSPNFSTVYIDSYDVGMTAAKIFAAKGHKRAALITPDKSNKPRSLCKTGFLDGCKSFDIEIEEGHIIEEENSFSGGKASVKKLIEMGTLPSALFIQNSYMAIGGIPLLKEKVKIPDDMEVISYGGNVLNEAISPSITAIQYPIEEMTESCMRVLLKMMQSGDNNPISQIIETKVEYRDSCPKPLVGK